MSTDRIGDEERELRPERLGGPRLRVTGSITSLPEFPEVRAGDDWRPSEGGAALLRAFESQEEADAYARAVQETVLQLAPPRQGEEGRHVVMILLTNIYMAGAAGAGEREGQV